MDWIKNDFETIYLVVFFFLVGWVLVRGLIKNRSDYWLEIKGITWGDIWDILFSWIKFALIAYFGYLIFLGFGFGVFFIVAFLSFVIWGLSQKIDRLKRGIKDDDDSF